MIYFKWFLIVVVILFGLFNILMSVIGAQEKNCEEITIVTGIVGAFCLGMGAMFISLTLN